MGHTVHIKDNVDFTENFPFAAKLLQFVQELSGDERWYIDSCLQNDAGEFFAIFHSYRTPEYRNYLLSVCAKQVAGNWEFFVQKKVTE